MRRLCKHRPPCLYVGVKLVKNELLWFFANIWLPYRKLFFYETSVGEFIVVKQLGVSVVLIDIK